MIAAADHAGVDIAKVRDVRLLARERGHRQGYAEAILDAHDFIIVAGGEFSRGETTPN